jgi:hypothetical protein
MCIETGLTVVATSLRERFSFVNGHPVMEGRPPLEPVLCEVEDRATGFKCILKLWHKTGTALDNDLCQLWRHETRQVERVMTSEGAREGRHARSVPALELSPVSYRWTLSVD